MEGYIKLHRKIFDNWIFERGKSLSYLEAWILLLCLTSYTKQSFLIDGQIIVCNRGQIFRSIKSLSTLFGWSEKRVKHFLKLLSRDNMITTQGFQKGTIITICNYDTYQNSGLTEGLAEVPTEGLTEGPVEGLTEVPVEGLVEVPTEVQQKSSESPHIINDNNYKKEKNVNNVEEENGGNSEAAIAGSGSVPKKDFSKGKEKNSTTRGKRGRPPAEIETFDPWLEQEEFRAAWAAWIAVRREKHNAVGPVAQRENMEHLRTLTDDMATAIAIVKYTTRGGYPMFYPLKTNNANPQKTAKNGFFNADTRTGNRPMDYDKSW